MGSKTYTLFWSKSAKTYILRRPGASSLKFGNMIPIAHIQQRAAAEAKKDGAVLKIREDK